MLAKKLHADWIPQMNVERGESYFFNVRTGESTEEHPNMKQVRACEKKQRGIAEAEMEERLARLKDYEQRLGDGQLEQLELYGEHAASVLRESSALWQPAMKTRWVCR